MSGSDPYPPPTDLPDFNPQTVVNVPQVADDAVVPSVGPGGQVVTGHPVVLDFADSQLNPHSASGKIGTGGEAPNESLLAGAEGSTPNEPEDGGKLGWLSLKRFQKYFDVDTKDVLWRMGNSSLGPFKGNFFDNVKDNPDLYGPFWITTTLVFLTAVSSNIVSWYNHHEKEHKDAKDDKDDKDHKIWNSDFSRLAHASILYYCYVFGVGLCVWGFLRCFKSEVHLSHVWCMYGYMMTTFLPISFLLMLPFDVLRKLSVAIVTIYSGIFLLRNFKEAIYSAAPTRATVVLVVLGLIHIGVGCIIAFVFH
ncbi:hypothetical protein BSKO_04911 [Bryopsis sp. KO-2023]|nr:hypothetical protein BSKO_04911 [Bryopsis sp. KO-2023]